MSKNKDKARAPWHFWLVGILSLLWNAMGAFDYYATQTGNEAYLENFTPEQLEFFSGFPTWVVAAWATAVWGGLLGSLLLLLRKRLAFPVFLLSFVCMVATAVHNYGFGDALEILGTFGAVFSVVIFVVALGLVRYSWRMMRQRVLV